MGGRAHSLAIPSVDGFSGAGWDCLDVCADVWKAALNDNNLRNMSGLQQNVKPALFEPSLQPCPPRPRALPPLQMSLISGEARWPSAFRCASAPAGRPLLVGGAFG